MRYFLSNLYIIRVAVAVLTDTLCFLAAATLTWFLLAPPFPPALYAIATAVGAFATFVALYYCDAYQLAGLGSLRHTISRLMSAMGLAFVAAMVLYFAIQSPPGASEAMANVAAIYFPLLLGERVLFCLVSSLPPFSQRVVVIGNGDLGASIVRAIRERPNLGIDLIGFLSDQATDGGAEIGGVRVLGQIHELEKLVEQTRIDRIVVASKSRSSYFPQNELLLAKLRGCRVESGVEFYERVTARVYLRDLRPSYLIFSPGFRLSRISAAGKRGLDLVLSAIGLLLIAPALALCAVAIRLDSPGPVFYRQKRVGRDDKQFEILKLRSMTDRAEEQTGPTWASEEDKRITRVGAILRKARLDELPQLWNVLTGDMSMVGPRPERPEFVETLSEQYPYFRLRSTLKPGITGWAQVRHYDGYVNDMPGFEEKLSLDLYYMKYRSFLMDLLILWKTLKTVVLLRGI